MIGLSIGLGLTSGGGASGIPVTAPFGFDYVVPFNITKRGGSYATDFSMDAVKPTAVNTIYVGAGGDNSATGLTWALRVRSLKQGLVKAAALSGVTRLICEARTYRYTSNDGSIPDDFAGLQHVKDLIIEPCDSSGNVLTGGTAASRRIISMHDETMPSWVVVSSGVYVSDYSTEIPSPGCLDLSNINAKGYPQALRYAPPASSYANEAAIVTGVAAQATAFGQGACWIDTVNTKFYAKTFDGRAPDSNIVVMRGGSNVNSANARNLYLSGAFGGTQKVWARDLHLWGGATLYAPTSWGSEARNINAWFADCSFSYSCINGVSTDGAGVFTFLRCAADDNYKDGFNYDQSDAFDANHDGVMRFHEIDCTADWNGNDSQSETSDNASSCHVRTNGVRVNTIAKRTLNRAFHDIHATKTWNLGCSAQSSRLTGDIASGAFAAGLFSETGSTAQMWLDGCSSINNDYDLEAYQGGTVYYANVDTTGFVNSTATGGTITTFNSPGVLPGATGALTTSTVTSTTVLLVFSAATGANSYQYRLNGAGSWFTLAGDKIVTGLTASTLYTFVVRAVSSDGYGSASNSANGTTSAPLTPTNILTNGDFSGGTTGWSGFGFSGKSVASGKATFASTPAFDGISQSISVSAYVGSYFELVYTLVRTANSIAPQISGGTTTNGASRSSSGTFSERILIKTGNTTFYFLPEGSGFSGTIDDATFTGPYTTGSVGGA